MELHEGQPVLTAAAPLAQARAAILLVHGRGATADSILDLTRAFDASGFAYLAPQAAGNTWYPQSFLAPISQNEPWLTSALGVIGNTLCRLQEAGIGPERTILLGFSQGACLALEYAARNARRYGGIVGLSGGLIGPDRTPRDYPGDLAGTPVFFGCSDVDFHIPAGRVRESAAVFERLGGQVTMRLYPNMGHTVNDDEIAAVSALMESLVG